MLVGDKHGAHCKENLKSLGAMPTSFRVGMFGIDTDSLLQIGMNWKTCLPEASMAPYNEIDFRKRKI
jgi:hypothetical protein